MTHLPRVDAGRAAENGDAPSDRMAQPLRSRLENTLIILNRPSNLENAYYVRFRSESRPLCQRKAIEVHDIAVRHRPLGSTIKSS